MHRLCQLLKSWFVDAADKNTPRTMDAALLEDRILYSATLMPVEWSDLQTSLESQPEQPEQLDQLGQLEQLILEELGQTEAFHSTAEENWPLDSVLSADSLAGSTILEGAADLETDAQRVEVMFVDGSISNVELLVEELLQQSFPNTRLEVSVLNSNEDGLAQISHYLSQGDRQADAIHFVALGTEGPIRLGQTRLDHATAATYEAEIRSWAEFLKEDAKLQFHGWETSGSPEEMALFSSLAEWTGATVTNLAESSTV